MIIILLFYWLTIQYCLFFNYWTFIRLVFILFYFTRCSFVRLVLHCELQHLRLWLLSSESHVSGIVTTENCQYMIYICISELTLLRQEPVHIKMTYLIPRGTHQGFSHYAQPKTNLKGVFERSQLHSGNTKQGVYFCWIHQVIKVVFELWRQQNHCNFTFSVSLSGGILDRKKGYLFMAGLRAGKRWIGIGTEWPSSA